MGQFNLIVQHPKPQKPVHGVLSIDKRGEAQFFTGNGEADSRIVGTMERTRVEHAAANGILLSGVERIGGKLRFQEWWLVYVTEGAEPLLAKRPMSEANVVERRVRALRPTDSKRSHRRLRNDERKDDR